MAKNYINGPLIREKQFNDGGTLLNCSISGDKIDDFANQLKAIIGADGWARFTIAKSREPKMAKNDPTKVVSTHYIYEDDRKPNQSGNRPANQATAQSGFAAAKQAVKQDDAPPF